VSLNVVKFEINEKRAAEMSEHETRHSIRSRTFSVCTRERRFSI